VWQARLEPEGREKVLRRRVGAMAKSLAKGAEMAANAPSSATADDQKRREQERGSGNGSADQAAAALVPPHLRSADAQRALTVALTDVSDLEHSLVQSDSDALGLAAKILALVGRALEP
jgi:hypothetical protein